jgi:hypothetical protein
VRRTSLLLAILLSVPALGYELTGQDWTWQAEPVEVPFEINLASWNVTGIDTTDVATAYASGNARWSEPLSDARVTAQYGGDTTSLDLTLDNVHIARYVDGAYPGATVALASVWSYTNGSGAGFNPWDIADCDIEFFGENDFGEILWSADPGGAGSTEMDIELVATHELGHCLGLNHSAEVDAVMFASAPTGTDPDKRDLHPDDLDGIYAIYGEPPNPHPLAPTNLICTDGNGTLEPGDSCTFDMDIADSVGEYELTLEWTNVPADILLSQTTVNVGEIVPPSSIVEIPFEVDSGCTTVSDVTLDYTLTDGHGRIWDSTQGDVAAVILTLECAAPPPPDPEMVFSSFNYFEAAGDGDGIIEAGESIRYEVFVENIGAGVAINVSAETTTASSELSVTNSPVSVGDFNPGDLFSFDVDFDVDSGCTSSQTDTLKVVLTDSNGLSWDFDLPVELSCTSPDPEFSLSSYTPSELVGDGDGIIEAGEQWRYEVVMENTGAGQGTALIAEFTAVDPLGVISILNTGQALGNFAPGDTKTFEIDFDVDTSCIDQETAYLEVSFEDTSGTLWDLSDDLPVELDCTTSPDLEISSSSYEDSTFGNNDGLLQEGETIRYSIEVQNVGNGNAESAQVSAISPSDPDVTLLSALPLFLGDMGPGDSFELDFDVAIDSACIGKRDTEIQVELSCGAGLPCTENVTLDLPLECALPSSGLYIDSYTFTEDDADNLIEAGETVDYTIAVRNPDAQDYTGVQATITSSHPDVSVGTPVVQADSANGVIESNDQAFLETVTLKIDQDCMSTDIAPLTILLEEDSGLSWTHEIAVELYCSAIGALVIESVEVYDDAGVVNGNGDGVLQEGEQGVELNITLLNPTSEEISGPVYGVIVTSDINFDPGSHELDWGSFGANQSQMSNSAGYLDVNADCTGTEALFDLELYDANYVFSHAEEFSLPIDCDEDDDGYPASEDCDDLNGERYPGNPESCDGIDNDCDGDIDEGITTLDTWYADSDGDGYGDASNTTEACTPPAGYVGDATDCDDTNAEISPGSAEICDELDNDCTGFADDGLLLYSYYLDTDGDGFGDSDTAIDRCGPFEGYVEDNTDCDDTQYSVAPNRTELCDGLDNDCDADIDEDCEADDDGDGWGASVDCDDTDSTINPDADELCDGVDQNCDGAIDNEAIDGSTYYTDGDDDGYGDPNAPVTACSIPAGSTINDDDCNDADDAINPDAIELCDGVDDDCDGLIDDDCQTDDDGDGYSSLVDCDDNDSAINPGILEVCDGIDNDCDTIIDDDATNLQIYYLDEDGDGFGTGATEALGCEAPDGYVENYLDCDDSTTDRSPDNAEVCDGIDNDCDLFTDNEAVDAETWYPDTDGDGFGDPDSPVMACTLQPGLVSNNLDCDDGRANVYPQAPETWYDGIDQNCDGIDDDRDQDGYPNAEDCDDTDSTVFPGSGDFDENCEPLTTTVDPKSPSPQGGGGCTTALPNPIALWWLAIAACGLRRRQGAG